MTLKLSKIVSNFPQEGLALAFAYGSGVFHQRGHKAMSQNMVDFIFAVDNAKAWHKENMRRNRKHYSFLSSLGPERIARVQENWGARVYFNTLVPCEDRLIKYGVISTSDLIDDLHQWETLYVSGRLHKPVLILKRRENPALLEALQQNTLSAMAAALLMLPEAFTEEQLYIAITSLSYTGDFRMTVGEDKQKVQNIVKPNVARFQELYHPMLDSVNHIHWHKKQAFIEQDTSPHAVYSHLNMLPKTLQNHIWLEKNRDKRHQDMEEVMKSLAHSADYREVVERGVQGIVKKSSITQSLKSILTAGMVKSVRYSAAKLRKMMSSKRQPVSV
ncbi:Phosphatidate cytidylyltransferase, mitochondrial [Branchiostoma belcheri]|nr:Phosphatidate cytidylyltransferase, mitochondrial [Branchiostoma belcheri]